MSEEDIEDRKRLVYQARLSEHCERYDDMVEAMKQVAQKYFPLDVDERNLMSVGYKNVVGQRRSALLTFNHLYQNAPDDQHISEYIKRVEDELDEKCHEILCDVSLLVPAFYNTCPLQLFKSLRSCRMTILKISA